MADKLETGKKFVNNEQIGEPQLRIFVVEDDKGIMDFIKMIHEEDFSSVSFWTEFHETGDSLVERLGEIKDDGIPTILSTDCNLRGTIQGNELIGICRQKFPDHFYAVMVSTRASDGFAIKAGADDYLTKPFDLDTYIGAINQAINIVSPKK